MPKIYAQTFVVYYEAHDLDLAIDAGQRFSVTITEAMRKAGYVEEPNSVAVPVGEAREATKQEHQDALAFKPDDDVWNLRKIFW